MKSFFTILVLCTGIASVAGFIHENEQPTYVTSKVALGKLLFNENILSLDSSVSCASCHNPTLAFADTVAFSKGINGTLTKRNVPSVLNMANRPYFFYDGRATTLQQQALQPIAHKDEMGLPIAEAVNRLNQNSFYSKQFYHLYKQKVTEKNLADVLAAFEKSLETTNSKFDDWANNKVRFTAAEERGRQLFTGNKSKCFECHFTEDFTDDGFKNIGLFNGLQLNDSGRYNITKKKADIGKFKTPGLRNVAITAPYMHNGQFKTLEEVLAYYNQPNGFFAHQQNIDPILKKGLGLTAQEQKDIIAFLKTLTDKAYIRK